MNRNGWIIFAAVCIGFLGFLVWQSNSDKIKIDNVNTAKAQPASEKNGNIGDHTLGKTDSKVTIVNYGDYQCPGCGSVEPVVEQVRDKYKDRVNFIFRNFPLSQIHPNALAAASAAEAAGLQGKFWEMHNLIYSQQDAWVNLNGSDRTEKFKSFAQQLNLNTEKFVKDTVSDQVSQKIKFDRAVASQDDITATPTFTLNGKKMPNDDWATLESASKAIDEALK